MLFQKEIRNPILSLMLLSLGGWLLHVRIHPPSAASSYVVPFLFGLACFLIVPVLLSYRMTLLVGYLLNGFSAVIGVVLMAHYSLADLPQPLTLTAILFRTTLPHVCILLTKLFIGQMILHHYFPSGLGRMFKTIWWVKHFCYFTIIYTIGHILLR